MTKDRKITVRLTSNQYEALKHYSSNRDMTVAEAIRNLIRNLEEFQLILEKNNDKAD